MRNYLPGNISRLLIAKNWTQGELAKRLDVTQSTISRWRDGSIPAGDRIAKLAQFAGTSPDEFLNKPWSITSSSDRATLPSEAELTEMLANVQAELPASLSFSDWPRVVAAALHERLAHYAGARSAPREEPDAPTTLHAATVRFRGPTRPDAPE
ncbi:MAG: helix-turn-helix transcriptional regulator [Sphingomonas sp.]|nr:helix-turn-helix transcriptional regulator [Sphingomonas sp.]MDX3885566.1 helix-turn-helix transcriptional regulator [Sphingomonas sp.]